MLILWLLFCCLVSSLPGVTPNQVELLRTGTADGGSEDTWY